MSLFLGLLISIGFAQVPQSFNYQALARDGSGNFLVSQNITIQFSILDGGPAGAVVFSETHDVLTDLNGLISAQVGVGDVVSGDFSTIDWSSGNFWLKTEMNIGNGMEFLGSQQLLSVPFALYAGNGLSPEQKAYLDALINANISPQQLVQKLEAVCELEGTPCDDGNPLTRDVYNADCVCIGTIIDDDGDGYGIDVDCNDSNPLINPDAVEVCGDQIDSNCNNDDCQ